MGLFFEKKILQNVVNSTLSSRMLPIYRLDIDEKGGTRVEANALVDVPAHMKGFISFGQKSGIVKYKFNEEKRIVTGVMMSANTPIYRRDDEFGEYYVYFSAETIEKIRKKFMIENRQHSVNEMHDPDKTIQKGIYMVDSYLIGGDKNPGVPEVFKGLNLQPGTWIASYFIEDDSIWRKVKSGQFKGFSVEGVFDMWETSLSSEFKANKLQSNMKNKRKTLSELLGFKKQEFAQATTSDGVVLIWEGDLADGTAVFVEVDGEQLPAPEGAHEVTLEDGSVKIVNVDSNGVVSSIEDVSQDMSADPEEIAEAMNAMRAEITKEIAETFKPVLAKIESLEKKFGAITTEKGSKFNQPPKKTVTETKKMTVSELMRAKNESK